MSTVWRVCVKFIRAALVASAVAYVAGDVTAGAADPPDGSLSAAEDAEATSVLALSDVVARTLIRNPDLAPFASQARADEARVVQAAVHPNPRADVVVEDVLGTGRFRGSREAQYTLQLSQLVELGGKRTARNAVATASRDLGRADYELKHVEVLSEATERFLDVLERQAILELARRSSGLSEDASNSIARRAQAGAGSPLDGKKAEVALARARVAAEDAEHELAVARTRLASSWGSTTARFERVRGDLVARSAIPPFGEVAAQLADAPDLARWASERQLRTAELELSRARRVPDLTLSAGPRRHELSDDQVLVVGFGLPLPLFDRNQGGIAEAEANIARTDAGAHATEIRLRATSFALYEALRHAGHVLDALERSILPGAESALTIAQDGFAQGRLSYLDLVDAQRTVVDVRREHVSTAATYHRLVLAIERLTGQPLKSPAAGSRRETTTPDGR
jgi:outer membrane protein, heavy metal efflux system